jgi:ATP-binding cassette subfamily F protein 3
LHVGGGHIADYDGDLDDYARFVQRANAEPSPAAAATAPAKRKDDRRERSDARARIAPLRKQMDKLEQRIAALGADKRALDAQLAEPTLYATTSAAQMLQMSQRASALAEQIATLEHEWLTAQDELDQAQTA